MALVCMLLGTAQAHAAKYMGGTPGSEGKTSEVMLANKETPSQLCDYLKAKLNKPVTCKLHGTNMVTVDAPVADVKKHINDTGAGTTLSSATAPAVKPPIPNAATAGLPSLTAPAASAEAPTAPAPVTTSIPAPEAASPPPVTPPPAVPPAPKVEQEVHTLTETTASSKRKSLWLSIVGITLGGIALASLITWLCALWYYGRKTSELSERHQTLLKETNGALIRQGELEREAKGLQGDVEKLKGENQQLAAVNEEVTTANGKWLEVNATLERRIGRLQEELAAAQKLCLGSKFSVPIPSEMMADGEPANLEMEIIGMGYKPTIKSRADERGYFATWSPKGVLNGLDSRVEASNEKPITPEEVLELLRDNIGFREAAQRSLDGRKLKTFPDTSSAGTS